MVAERQIRRVLVGVASLAIALSGVIAAPSAALAAGPAMPDVTASGPNVFQKAKNDPIYFKPMAGRASGTYIRTYGNAPTSEYYKPSDVAVYGSYIYVLDAGNFRILKRRASDLSFVKASGTLIGRVDGPERIATDGTYLYVTDALAGKIVVFKASTLAYVGSFGSKGTGTGHFALPSGIAVAGGHLYVADTDAGHVVRLSTWPIKWQAAFGTQGSGKAQFDEPMGVAVIGSYLYVADSKNGRLVRMSTAMTATGWKVISSYGSPAAPLDDVEELASDGTYLYAFALGTGAIVKLTSSLGYVKSLNPTGSKAWGLLVGMGASSAGLYLAHSDFGSPGTGYDHQITKNSLSTLAVAKTSGLRSPSPNQWHSPLGSTSDGTNLYISENRRIIVCPLAGSTCTRNIPLPPGYRADSITTDGSRLFVVDYLGSRVYRINIATGLKDAEYGTQGSGVDNLSGPTGIAYVAALDQVVVVDSGNSRIVARHASDLSYVGQGGSAGSGDNQFSFPEHIASDGGFLYITDTGNDRVVKWAAVSLAQDAAFGTSGSGPGQLDGPVGIATDADSVWVADRDNHRIQRLSAADLSLESTQSSSTSMPFTIGLWALTSVGGKLLIGDNDHSRAYLEWGGGPLAVNAKPSDGTSPLGIAFTWPSGAPAGWTSATDSAVPFTNDATRYLGWSSTAQGGTMNVTVNTLFEAGTPRPVQLIADATAPSTHAPFPVPATIATTSTTSIKAQIIWDASDAGAGVKSTQLARSVNGGAWTLVSSQNSTGAPATDNYGWVTTLKTGTTYRFRARSTDMVGNVSAWKTAASFTVAMIQENGTGVTASSGWTRKAESGAIGGYLRIATAAGRTLTYKGTMSTGIIYFRRTATAGSIKVYVDGIFLGSISTSNPTLQERVGLPVYMGAKGTHTIKIVTVGDGPVAIDAFCLVR